MKKENMNKGLLKLIGAISMAAAKAGSGNKVLCLFLTYQPKMPDKLKNEN
jgi:cyclic lactone autoinducer peptide